jgi:tetratricopeptide (TPR) repeat protein
VPPQTRPTDRNPVATAVLLVLAAVLLVEVPAGNDPHFPWKYAALLVGTGVALVLAITHLWAQRARPRWSWPAALLVVFLVALVVRGAVADVPFEWALVGTLYRYDGILLYLAGAALLLLAWQYLEPWRLLRALVVIAAVVSIWALLTAPVGDPLLAAYATSERAAVESTLGNANFLAAFLALSIGPCLAVALHHSGGWRWMALATLLGVAVTLPLTRSLQAVPVAAVSAALVLLAWGEGRPGRHRLLVRVGLGGAAVVASLAAVSIVTGAGPGAGLQASEIGTIQARAYYWQVAADAVQDEPLGGLGPAQYREAFSPRRSVEAAVNRPFDSVDAPHNVVLKLAAENGLLVAALYVGFVAAVGFFLARGVLRLRGPQRLALAGVGAGWAGYQVQSLVSIEVVPLAAVHWVTAGVILGATTARPFTDRRAVPVRRALVSHKPVAVAVAALLVLSLPLLLRPVRADLAVASATRAAAAGDLSEAEAKMERVRGLAPYEPEYAFRAGQALEQRQELGRALEYYRAAAAQEPGNARYQLAATRSAAALGDQQQTLEHADALLTSDPHNPVLLGEVARLRLQAGRADEALRTAARFTEILPESGEAWILRGQAAVAAGEEEQARAAFETALRLEPGSADARSALEALAASERTAS